MNIKKDKLNLSHLLKILLIVSVIGSVILEYEIKSYFQDDESIYIQSEFTQKEKDSKLVLNFFFDVKETDFNNYDEVMKCNIQLVDINNSLIKYQKDFSINSSARKKIINLRSLEHGQYSYNTLCQFSKDQNKLAYFFRDEFIISDDNLLKSKLKKFNIATPRNNQEFLNLKNKIEALVNILFF